MNSYLLWLDVTGHLSRECVVLLHAWLRRYLDVAAGRSVELDVLACLSEHLVVCLFVSFAVTFTGIVELSTLAPVLVVLTGLVGSHVKLACMCL